MIIITDKSVANTIKIQANLPKSATGLYKLRLVDCVNKKTYEYNVTDTGTSSSLFYTFSVNLSLLPFGEYNFTVLNTSDVVQSTGIIRLSSTIEREIYDLSVDYVTYDVTQSI